MKRLMLSISILVLAAVFFLGRNYYSRNIDQVAHVQRRQISTLSRELRGEEPVSRGKVMLIFLLYGVVHSLGPGHGKSIVSGIFLSDHKGLGRITLFSGIICFSQGLTAFLMVKAFTILGEVLLPQYAFNTEEDLRLISAFFILIIGFFMLYSSLSGTHKHTEGIKKSSLGAAVLLGVTPCFGTVNLLLFLGALGFSRLQFLGALSVSMGMFITVTLVGILTVTFKRAGRSMGTSWIRVLEAAGPLIMILYSLSLLRERIPYLF